MKNTLVAISRDINVHISFAKDFFDFHKYIYEKYSIDSLQLVESQNFYAKSPKIYLEMHNHIKFNMERLIDSIDVLSKEEIRKIKENQSKDFRDLNQDRN